MGVDVDFWVAKADTMGPFAPYMSASWREWTRAQEPGRAVRLPEGQYFLAGPELQAAIASPDPVALARARLDALGHDALAVLNPGAASNVSGYGNLMLAADMARAVNRYTRAWLDHDPRLRGAIVISPRDPDGAALEIRRAAGEDARMVAVLLAYPQQPLGHRRLDPIYHAASELGLPVMLEAGGAYAGSNQGLTTIGDPANTFQALLSWEHAAQPHLISLLTTGVFDRYPTLRVVFSGFGVAWLPSLLWRLDHEYRRQRAARPAALTRAPSEYVPAHVRFTTATLELPPDPTQLLQLLEPVGGAELLLRGSGPLGDHDTHALLNAADAHQRARINHDNAHDTYPHLAATTAPAR